MTTQPEFTDEDMAAVGRALMEALHDNREHRELRGWHPLNSPAEIVVDLLNRLDDQAAEARAAARDFSERVSGLLRANNVEVERRRRAEGYVARVANFMSTAQFAALMNATREIVILPETAPAKHGEFE
jgi:hypothetical protein